MTPEQKQACVELIKKICRTRVRSSSFWDAIGPEADFIFQEPNSLPPVEDSEENESFVPEHHELLARIQNLDEGFAVHWERKIREIAMLDGVEGEWDAVLSYARKMRGLNISKLQNVEKELLIPTLKAMADRIRSLELWYDKHADGLSIRIDKLVEDLQTWSARCANIEWVQSLVQDTYKKLEKKIDTEVACGIAAALAERDESVDKGIEGRLDRIDRLHTDLAIRVGTLETYMLNTVEVIPELPDAEVVEGPTELSNHWEEIARGLASDMIHWWDKSGQPRQNPRLAKLLKTAQKIYEDVPPNKPYTFQFKSEVEATRAAIVAAKETGEAHAVFFKNDEGGLRFGFASLVGDPLLIDGCIQQVDSRGQATAFTGAVQLRREPRETQQAHTFRVLCSIKEMHSSGEYAVSHHDPTEIGDFDSLGAAQAYVRFCDTNKESENERAD